LGVRRSEAQLRVGPGAQSRGGHQRLSFSHAARRGIAEPHLSRSFFRVGEEKLRSQGLTSSAGRRGSNFVGRKPPHAHPLHTYMLSLLAGGTTGVSAVEGQARGAAKRAGWETTSDTTTSAAGTNVRCARRRRCRSRRGGRGRREARQETKRAREDGAREERQPSQR